MDVQMSKSRTRKSHPKSRNGCSQCRRSRIKCNEQAPRCNHCNRRGIQCDFENEQTRFKVLTPPWDKSQHTAHVRPKATNHASVVVPHHDLFPVASFEQCWPTAMLWEPSPSMLDSKKSQIFQHFVTDTSLTLSSYDIPDGFWCTDVPRLALQNEYLLNAVCAVSALHRSYLQHTNNLVPPDVNKSIAWHRRSVELFATTIANITPENCVPALAMAGITALYSCGVAQLLSSMQKQEHVDQFIGVISVAHKALQLFRPFTSVLHTKGLLLPTQNEAVPGAPDTQTFAKNSSEVAKTSETLEAMISISNFPPYETRVYRDGIAAFRTCERGNWMATISTEFLGLLQKRRRMALLILTAFSISENNIEATPWYFSLWHDTIRTYFKELLGPLWNEYENMRKNADNRPGADSCPLLSAAINAPYRIM